MLRIAFKEWAVICRALAEGRQALILRKGGIAEAGGEFTPEHRRFWLYPTYAHEKPNGIKPDAVDLFRAAEADRPPAAMLRLTHFAEVSGVYHVRQLFGALLLDDLHVWSETTVRHKFEYRSPGLYVLPVRVFRAAAPTELPETPAYAGCRTWVELDRELPTAGATPVLGGAAFDALLDALDRRLTPTALA
ncbi:MAG TPA: DUF1802 family protein [Gemmataceae bacterium]|jgi:hypothetical protein